MLKTGCAVILVDKSLIIKNVCHFNGTTPGCSNGSVTICMQCGELTTKPSDHMTTHSFRTVLIRFSTVSGKTNTL